MSLDQQLHRASEEIHQAVTDRRGVPIQDLTRRSRTMRATAAVAVAFAVVAIGVTALVLPGPPTPTLPPAGTTVTPTSTTTSQPPVTTAPTTSAPPTTGSEDTGLSGADLLPEPWQQGLEDGDLIILMEEGIGLAVTTVTELEVGSYQTLSIAHARFVDAMYLLGSDYVAYELPDLLVGFAATQDDPQVTLFGIVPPGTVEVELRWPTGTPLRFDRVFARPEVDRAVFIGTIPESDLIERASGPSEVAVVGTDGSVTRPIDFQFQSANVRDDYTGPITSDLFRIPQPLIAASRAIEEAPEVIPCYAGEGVTPPPKQRATVTWVGTHPTPAEALAAFLAEEVGDPPIADSGYLEMTEPDGSILYGIDFGDGFVTLISAIPVDNGWTVDGWEASGC